MPMLLVLKKIIIKKTCLGFILFAAAFISAGIIPQINEVMASDSKATDLERIQAGLQAPDFNLESVDGNWVKFSNYQNKKNVVLIFYRGYW